MCHKISPTWLQYLRTKPCIHASGGEGLDSESLLKCWKSMQNNINLMIDSSKGETKAGEDAGKGKKQELERKEGLMRMNMMGEREIMRERLGFRVSGLGFRDRGG